MVLIILSSDYKNQDNNNMHAEVAHTSLTETETLLLVSAVEEVYNDTWFLDTGCSNHMCGNKESFVNWLNPLRLK